MVIFRGFRGFSPLTRCIRGRDVSNAYLLVEMMEKSGLLVMQDILEELHYDPETWCYDAEGKRQRYVAYVKNFQKSFQKVA